MWFLYLPVALLLAYFLYNRYLHPLSKVPGPLLASLTPLWITWQGYNARRPRLDIDLHKQYGSVVRISPDEIIFSNPAYFKTVYGAGTRFQKGRFYEAPTDMSQPEDWEKLDMLPEMNIAKLRTQKRYAAPVYAVANAKKHEHYVDNNIRRMVTRLSSVGGEGKVVDVYYEWEIMNVDVMTEMTFGKEYGAVEKGSDDGHMHGMDKMWEWWGWMGYLPWLNEFDKRFMPRKVIFSGSSINLPVFPYCVGKIIAHGQATAEGKDTKPCILDDFRRLSKTQPAFIENWGTRLALTDLGAGVDTMSWTLAAAVVGISSNPPVLARLRSELDAAVAGGHISKDTPVPYDAAAKLPYLQACLHEALRLWPNVAISLPRTAPSEGIEIDGHYIPSGYTVGMNSKQLGLNTTIFGPDTESFKPERWLEADKARRNDMETRNLSFGGPSRKCIGMHTVWVSMSKVLASFYLNFDLRVLNELDGKPGPGGGVWCERGSFPTKWHGLEVEIVRR
ncbi:hypothetical protein M409DRAFT_69322 [Zasmidium cellare ATCC 36951]|uniref:Cytochrome P450 n=1 Tax=Zasmidium cellare ATCC 36951 TaxID=1080233 RepID=A0A6A6C4K6_ZASCE|nr:uncharacterized protein M409DRAFT_69322 [Zasmidium cellare ATCC 36951]KAF2162097.1 hypothetical protein M409DRAFT_69322 [Zasmidium cellare ATCC 36951]